MAGKGAAARAALSVFVLSVLCFPQRFTLQNYSVDDGVSTQRVNAVAQDASGFIWAATQSGVSQFNGVEWKNFDTADGLPEGGYRFIASDARGRVWAAPEAANGFIVVYENGHWRRVFNLSSSLPKGYIRDFAVLNENGNSICIIAGDSTLYEIENGSYRNIGERSGTLPYRVNCLLAVNGRILAGTSNGVIAIRDGIIERETAFTALNQSNVLALAANRFAVEEEISVMTGDAVYLIAKNTSRRIAETSDFGIGSKYCIALRPPFLFYGHETKKRAVNYLGSKQYSLGVESGFSTEGMRSVFVCREGQIWISDLRGIDKITMPYFTFFDRWTGLAESEVSAVAELRPGVMVFGHNNSISIESGDGFRKIEIPPRGPLKSTARVMEFARDGKGNLFVVSNALYRLTPNGNLTLVSAFEGRIFSVKAAADKSVWVCGERGVFVDERGTGTFRRYAPMQTMARKLRLAGDRLYVCGGKGLYVIDIPARSLKTLVSGLSSRYDIFDVCVRNDSSLLVATNAGLLTLKEGEYKYTRLREETLTSPVYALLTACRGFMFGTNQGFVYWEENIEPEKYDQWTGLLGNEVNRGALMMDSQNRYWIGTERGVTCYDPAAYGIAVPAPQIIITRTVHSGGISTRGGENIELPYADNFISFHFAIPSYINEKRMEFEYRLSGADTSFKRVGYNQLGNIGFSGLQSGVYVLEVRARNRNGMWGEITRSAEITVAPPFYFSFWFLAIVFCIAGGGYIAMSRYTADRRYRTHLETAVRDRTSELHHSQQELLLLNRQLEQRVAERTKELEQANARLREDIEAKKRMNLAIQEARERYETVFQTSGEAMLLLDAQTGAVADANEAACRLYGYMAEEFSEMNILALSDEKEKSLSSLEAPSSHIPFCRHRKKSGEIFPAEVFSGTFVQSGKRVAVVSVRDISSFLDTQSKLEAYSRALEEINLSKDKFFSIIAHDLKSPFQGLLGFSDLLMREYDAYSDDERLEMLRRLHGLSQKAYELVENLLYWSRLQLGRVKPHPRVFSPREIVFNAFDLLCPQANGKSLVLENNVDESLSGYADDSMIRQVILNLLSNAIKYSPKGKRVHFSGGTDNGGNVVISVEDEGAGIPVNDRARLFKLDEQLITSGTGGEKGTGLGLIISKALIELNNGTLHCDASKNGGSVFRITFPAG